MGRGAGSRGQRAAAQGRPRARQDQPRGGVLHGPGNPLRQAEGHSGADIIQAPSHLISTRRHPRLPYLQGAGVPIDQQAEDRDLDAAGSCGQMEHSVHPGARVSRGPGRPPATPRASDHQPAARRFWANPGKRLFSRGAPAVLSPGQECQAHSPLSSVFAQGLLKRQVEHRVPGHANHVPKAGISRPGQEAPLTPFARPSRAPEHLRVWKEEGRGSVTSPQKPAVGDLECAAPEARDLPGGLWGKLGKLPGGGRTD